MGTKAPDRAQIVVAVLFALSVFAFTLFVWKSFGGSVPLEAKGYEVRMSFGRDAANLVTNADVRIAGVNVGKVSRIEPVGTRIEATVELDPRYVPLPSDARAIVRAKTLLGETFIEMSPGTDRAPPVPDGGALRTANIQEAEGLDEVLGAFDAETRRSLKGFLDDLSVALEDRGQDISAVLGNAAPATRDLRRLLEVLDAERPAVRSLIRDTSTTLAAISEREDDLRALVRSGDELLGATAARDERITETIEELPGFLTDARAMLAEVEATSREAAPTLRVLRPVAPLVEPALDETSRLAPVLEDVFAGLDPAITAAREGLPAATAVVKAALPVVQALLPAGRQLVPVVQTLDLYAEDTVIAAANVGAATNSEVRLPDGTSRRVLRVLPPIWSEGLLGYENRLPSNRYNPYPSPGAHARAAKNGNVYEAFDCRHTENPEIVAPLGSSPPCVRQEPWTFQGKTRSFPNVAPAEP